MPFPEVKYPAGICEWEDCGRKYFKRQHNQRFCCSEHRDAYHNAERLEAVKRFRAEEARAQ